MNRSTAIKLLGLSESFTDSDLKKAYRKKALKYHPDVNKSSSAKEKFVEIYDAYEYLLNNKRDRQSSTKSSSTWNHRDRRERRRRRTYSPEDFEERFQKAKKAAREKMEKEDEMIMEKSFIEYKNGWKRVYMKFLAPVAALLSIFLVIDHYLEPRVEHFENIEVTKKDEFLGDMYFMLFKGERVVIDRMLYRRMKSQKEKVKVFKRNIFGDIIKVEVDFGTRIVTIEPSFNIHQVFPLINLILFIPLISFFIERPKFYFVFIVVYGGIYVVSSLIVIILYNRMDTFLQ